MLMLRKAVEFRKVSFSRNYLLRHGLLSTTLLEKYQIRRHSLQTTKAYIFAHENVSNLLEVKIEQNPRFALEKERFSRRLPRVPHGRT